MATQSLSTYVQSAPVAKRFTDVLGEKEAKRFCSALISICNGNKQLQECDPRSITAAAGLAAITGLSIVPYKHKAQFQVGWKGLVQLAHRTGKYTALNAGKVCEGEITGINPVTGEAILGEKLSDEVVGYVAYMRLTNGFEKTLYMTKAEIEEHALKYSQSYAYDKNFGKKSSPWSTNFDAMASKTVLKRLLNNYGILSTEMAEVIQADQGIVDKNTITYVDNGDSVQSREDIFVPTDDDELTFDTDTGEIINGGLSNAQD